MFCESTEPFVSHSPKGRTSSLQLTLDKQEAFKAGICCKWNNFFGIEAALLIESRLYAEEY